jgi:hypothetical protein
MQHDYKASGRETRARITTENHYCEIIHAHGSYRHRICGIKLLRENGTVALVRAYVVITANGKSVFLSMYDQFKAL